MVQRLDDRCARRKLYPPHAGRESRPRGLRKSGWSARKFNGDRYRSHIQRPLDVFEHLANLHEGTVVCIRDLEIEALFLADVPGGLLLRLLKVLPIGKQEQSDQTRPRLHATILRW